MFTFNYRIIKYYNKILQFYIHLIQEYQTNTGQSKLLMTF